MATVAVRQQLRVRKPGNSTKVLLVEDSRMFTVALSKQITSSTGADVYCCSTLAEMASALEGGEAGFAVVVADLNLEDSPESEVLDLVAQCGLPTIVFTGNFALEDGDIPRRANIVDFILKDSPSVFDDVVSSVKSLLNNDEIRVLVAGGEIAMRNLARGLLRGRRFLVAEADCGKDALAQLVDLPDIGLVIVDHNLPDMSGEALVRAIRRDFNKERIRIVGTAVGGSTSSSLGSFRRAGADDFVVQPFFEDEFNQRVAGNVDTLTRFRKLQAIASRDFLTNMYNRRHFFERGPVLVRHSLELNEPVCAAIMDIDHFKKFNDTYGHETGDVVLKAVARKIREIVGDEYHLSARLGGEEFAMLFRNMDLENATVFCDRLRQEVADTRVVADEEELSVTISIGLAEITEIETFDNYLHAADQYLYMAKNSGRNCVFSDYSIVQMFSDRSA